MAKERKYDGEPATGEGIVPPHPTGAPKGKGWLVRRSEASRKPGSLVSKMGTSSFAVTYPALYEFLSVDCWPDGEPRDCGSLILFVEEGLLKVCLSDRAQDMVAFRSGCDLADCLSSIDSGLQDGSLDWRQGKRGGKRGKGS